MSRIEDKKIAESMGWRVSFDAWWNWNKMDDPPGFYFNPPGDGWCVRRDGRNDLPCNEALPHFSTETDLTDFTAGNA